MIRPNWKNQGLHDFLMYGPLNAYFSLKFSPSHFLVKPQALLREEAAQAGDDGDDEAGDQSFSSIDSHGWSYFTWKTRVINRM